MFSYVCVCYGFCMSYFIYDFVCQGFRAAAEQQLKEAKQQGSGDQRSENLEPLRKQINIIYDQYLSEKVSNPMWKLWTFSRYYHFFWLLLLVIFLPFL